MNDTVTEVTTEIAKVQAEIAEAVEKRLASAIEWLRGEGISDDRITKGPLDIDKDVIYIQVDGTPVHRIVVAYDTDSVNLFGSWLFENLDKLGAN